MVSYKKRTESNEKLNLKQKKIKKINPKEMNKKKQWEIDSKTKEILSLKPKKAMKYSSVNLKVL